MCIEVSSISNTSSFQIYYFHLPQSIFIYYFVYIPIIAKQQLLPGQISRVFPEKKQKNQQCDPRLNTDGPLAPAMEIGQRPGESVPS